MKVFFLFLFFCCVPIALYADYFDYLLEQDEVEVDCSNVLDFVKEYINLSEKNQSLLVVSANRFLSSAGNDNTQESSEREEAVQDVNQTIYFVQDNQMILSDKASIILSVLPDCLKSAK